MFPDKALLGNPFKTVYRLWLERQAAYKHERATTQLPWKARWHMLTGHHTTTSHRLVPIRSLGPWHRARVQAHLLALSRDDRYMRFGYAARDEQIIQYVQNIDFKRDHMFGIFNRKLELIAVAHLARSEDEQHRACAEFGVSVSANARGRGYGSLLFNRAAMHARNHGVKVFFIHALSENTAMLRIARKAGARVQRDGSESNAYLSLPPPDVEGYVHELLDEQMAKTDYWMKLQAREFRKWMSQVHFLRFGEHLPAVVESTEVASNSPGLAQKSSDSKQP